MLKEDKILTLLKEHDIRPSYQRIQILGYLLEDDNHPTADIIFTNLQTLTPAISRATVYNTLNLFEEKGLVSTMTADKFETRYDLYTDEHGHFVCKLCGGIYNFDYKYHDAYEELEGFDIEKEEILVKGVCKKCK